MGRIKIGVMGSAWGKEDEETAEKARIAGKAITENGCILVTGSCNGIPHEAAKASKEAGGFVVGISPAHNMQEHTELYKYPADIFDLIVYTGFGKKGRNVIEIRSCDAVIFISGGSGTLNEFTIAYDEGKVCGILQDSGGISGIMKELEGKYLAGRKKSGKAIYHTDPEKLVEDVIKELKSG